MLINVRHTDYQRFVCVQPDFMEGIYCEHQWGHKVRNFISVSKMAAVSCSNCLTENRHFHIEATLDTIDVH